LPNEQQSRPLPGRRGAEPERITINDQAGQLDAALTAKPAIAIDSTNARILTSTELRRHFFIDSIRVDQADRAREARSHWPASRSAPESAGAAYAPSRSKSSPG
jgi:hypothetical protein